jgi:hypothetical protein
VTGWELDGSSGRHDDATTTPLATPNRPIAQPTKTTPRGHTGDLAERRTENT